MEKNECLGCGSQDTIIAFEVKYRGLRGTCRKCGANCPSPEFVHVRFRFILLQIYIWKVIMKMQQMTF